MSRGSDEQELKALNKMNQIERGLEDERETFLVGVSGYGNNFCYEF